MKISEILVEDVLPETTINTIVDILTTQLPGLYRQLSAMADRYVENHGRIDKGFAFITGGPKNRWFHDVYFKNLQPALYNLVKNLPPNISADLKKFLSDTVGKGKFKDVQDTLIGILGNIASRTRNKRLDGAVSAAKHAIRNYQRYISGLGHDDEEDDIEEPTPKKSEEPSLTGQHNAAVEAIINDALARLGGKQAGEIRNAIARSGNKLQALQHEFNKRGITL
jgi:hypothetical protein